MTRKRILILSASVGSGHKTAAAALEKILRRYPQVEVVNQDALELTNDAYRMLAADAYNAFVQENPWLVGWWYDVNDEPFKNEGLARKLFDLLNAQPLVKFIKSFDPHISVCTHFMPAGIIAQLMAERAINTSLAIVTTDYDFQGMWLSKTFNRYFVALEETRAHLTALGLAEDRVTVSGIPVDPIFEEPVDREAVLATYGLRPNAPILLISAGAVGGGPAREIVAQVMRLQHDYQAVVVCGKNTQLRREAAALAYPQAERFRVLGYTNDMPNLMRVATLFIGKPGGLTASECMAAGLPMLIVQPIPGQEERNSDHLLEEGAAVRCNDLATVAFKIDRLLAEPERLARMQANARRFGRPDAARAVVETLLAEQPEPVLITGAVQRRIVAAARGVIYVEPPSVDANAVVALYNAQTGVFAGTLTEEQFAFLRANLEDEHAEDDDYFINLATVELLQQRGADADLLAVLERALNGQGQSDVRWIRL